MLADIKKFFDRFIQTASANNPTDNTHRLRLATAALLIEVTRADHVIHKEELAAVKQALQQLFALPESEIETLVLLANKESDNSADHYEFTSLINLGFDASTKVKIIEMLWRVVFADAKMDKYEEATVRKIADLIYVPHHEFIAAKQRARAAS
jgi:uncharacterized tellurite resistance protein B-like protein